MGGMGWCGSVRGNGRRLGRSDLSGVLICPGGRRHRRRSRGLGQHIRAHMWSRSPTWPWHQRAGEGRQRAEPWLLFPIWDEVRMLSVMCSRCDACCWFWFDGMMISVVLVGRGAPLKVRHCDDARYCIRYRRLCQASAPLQGSSFPRRASRERRVRATTRERATSRSGDYAFPITVLGPLRGPPARIPRSLI